MTVASRPCQRASAFPYSRQIAANRELDFAAVGPSAKARYEPSITKCVNASSANQTALSVSAYERDAVASGERRGGIAPAACLPVQYATAAAIQVEESARADWLTRISVSQKTAPPTSSARSGAACVPGGRWPDAVGDAGVARCAAPRLCSRGRASRGQTKCCSSVRAAAAAVLSLRGLTVVRAIPGQRCLFWRRARCLPLSPLSAR